MTFATIFLQAQPGGSYTTLFLMMGMIAVFYFFMIRPQAKKAKQQKTFINELQKGDKVVTIAGIHGKINRLNDDGTIELETSPGAYMKIEKSAISMEWSAALQKSATNTATK